MVWICKVKMQNDGPTLPGIIISKEGHILVYHVPQEFSKEVFASRFNDQQYYGVPVLFKEGPYMFLGPIPDQNPNYSCPVALNIDLPEFMKVIIIEFDDDTGGDIVVSDAYMAHRHVGGGIKFTPEFPIQRTIGFLRHIFGMKGIKVDEFEYQEDDTTLLHIAGYAPTNTNLCDNNGAKNCIISTPVGHPLGFGFYVRNRFIFGLGGLEMLSAINAFIQSLSSSGP